MPGPPGVLPSPPPPRPVAAVPSFSPVPPCPRARCAPAPRPPGLALWGGAGGFRVREASGPTRPLRAASGRLAPLARGFPPPPAPRGPAPPPQAAGEPTGEGVQRRGSVARGVPIAGVADDEAALAHGAVAHQHALDAQLRGRAAPPRGWGRGPQWGRLGLAQLPRGHGPLRGQPGTRLRRAGSSRVRRRRRLRLSPPRLGAPPAANSPYRRAPPTSSAYPWARPRPPRGLLPRRPLRAPRGDLKPGEGGPAEK